MQQQFSYYLMVFLNFKIPMEVEDKANLKAFKELIFQPV